MFKRSAAGQAKIYGVAPGRPFFCDLVTALLEEVGPDLSRLADMCVYVPSRRSARALKMAFAELAPRKVMLLPKIVALADLDEEDMPPAKLAREEIAPAPSSAAKRLKLAAIYHREMKAQGHPVRWAGALIAASELAKTSDLLSEYGVTEEAIARLEASPDIEEGAAHWKSLVRMLRIVTEEYPAWLEEEGFVDGRTRRAELLRDLVGRLEEQGRDELVVAAGFLGTTPSTIGFLKAVAKLPAGAVVLPGLDFGMDPASWDAIEAPHPQHVFKCLLEEALDGMSREDVTDLASPACASDNHPSRTALLSLALTPAEATSNWAEAFAAFQSQHTADQALGGLRYAKAATIEEEADFIALTLREVLETKGKTAYLVTADRLLARRVASRLAGWGIEIDDSGGTPLRGSYRATFLRLVCQLMISPSDAPTLAGLIGHQLFGLGLDAKERRPLVQAFDLFLRGRQPREGWDGLERSLSDEWRPHAPRPDSQSHRWDRARRLLSKLKTAFEPPIGEDDVTVSAMLDRHLAIAETLAATSEESGAERLFRFEDGEALETHLAELKASQKLLGRISPNEYPDVFDALLEGPAVRPPGGQHPRLAIYGLLEARLQKADLVIVGGLQEGVWPVEAPVDPFVSRGMRSHLGLPAPELDIGRVAHDFLDFASQPEVLLTRSLRQGRTPARASRLMVRLESFLDQIDQSREHDAAPRLRALANYRFGGEGSAQPASRPRPKAPLELLPKRISISTVGTWLRDPYEVFAGKILNLKPLEPYAAPFTHSDRGMLLHALAERFSKEGSACEDDGITEHLEGLLPDMLSDYDMPAVQRQLNAKFLRQATQHFQTFETEARQRSEFAAAEEQGSWVFTAGGKDIEITGRADRIDRFPCGGLHAIDYKKSDNSSLLEQKTYSPQLFLTALMLRDGGFTAFGPAKVEQISFVVLTGEVFSTLTPTSKNKDGGKRWMSGERLQSELAEFESKFRRWAEETYSGEQSFVSQIHPKFDDPDGPYDWLARRGEWAKDQGLD